MVEQTLRDEVIIELDEISKVEFGSQTYKTGVDGATQLTDRLIELYKLDAEGEKLEFEKQKLDLQRKQHQLEVDRLEADKKDRKSKNRLAVFGTVVPVFSTLSLATLAALLESGGWSAMTQFGRKVVDKCIFRGR